MNFTLINPLFHGTLSPHQLNGVYAITDGCAHFGITDQRMIAYILATAFWESGRTMQPVEEYGKGAGHKYGQKIKQSGQTYATPDKVYYGRGHTQNTWYENYLMLENQTYAKQKGWNFLDQPELLLEMEPSVWATIHCMWHGSYTGVALCHYFNDHETDPLNARRIINGTDQAAAIAGFYDAFYKSLTT